MVVPLAATTFGAVGQEAQRFFDAVVAERATAASGVADELSFQHLHSGQHRLMWRRRITTFLRICIASLAVARVRVSQGERSPARGERRERQRLARGFQVRAARGELGVGTHDEAEVAAADDVPLGTGLLAPPLPV